VRGAPRDNGRHRPEARGFITGGLNHVTVQPCQGGCHERIPDVLITALSELFQENEVAHGLDGHQAQSTRAGFILGHGDGFARHVLGQVCGFGLVVVNDGLFNLKVDLLLSPIGGGDKAVQSREVEQETDQTNATSTHFDTDQVQGSNEPMEEGQARATLKELGHMGPDIERIMP